MQSSADAVAQRLQRTPTPFAIVHEVAQRRPDHPALVFMRTATDRAPLVMTYRELVEQTARAIGALRGLRIAEDEGIAMLLPAMPETVVALLAASSVGVAFPLNLLLAPEAMRAQLELARVRAAFVLGPHPALDVNARLRQAARNLPALEAIVEVPAADEHEGTWRSFLESATLESAFAGKPDRTAALFHTGGTTGEPKLAELSARNVAAGALMMSAATRWNENDRICSGLPWFHVGGAISCGLNALSAGATLVLPGLLGARDPEVVRRIWQLLGELRATIAVMVPTSLAAAVDIPVGDADLTALRAVCTGASPLPKELGARIEAKLSRPVCQIYGMTELSGSCSAQPCDGRIREPAVGYPVPLLQIELRSAEGRASGRGEVHMRGPNSFQGYRSRSGTSGVPVEGWVSSGDLGRFLADEQLRLLGRSKDVIIRGGHNIDPLAIEEIALQHPAVHLAAAVPMPDEYAGELPVLYVALKPGVSATTEEIDAFVHTRIPEPPARPKRVFILDDLPLTPFGKIARYKLRQAAAVYRIQGSVAGAELAEFSCQDATAKTIIVHWHRAPAAETLSKVAAVAGALGLVIETV
jgi:fatty-acyl-CoA synthase